MKPIKQTVYLPVNGETEFIIAEYENGAYIQGIKEIEGYFFTPEQLNEYTQAVIKQALETAAEKAKIMDVYKKRWSSIKLKEESFVDKDIHKESITNTFEETFKNFKV